MNLNIRLYETHLQVSNLEHSITFYEQLGLTFAHKIDDRRCAFFYFGDDRQQMLGLWEVGAGQRIASRHIAFDIALDELLNIDDWLRERGIEPCDAFDRPPVEPMVLTWMPAASVYFYDPDHNLLEFIALLEQDAAPAEPCDTSEINSVPYLSEWLDRRKTTQ
ncbi:VOC family protein [Paenibacillus sp. 481]|uniref:VOC family protein n=1 Tax=Paenibacillus sp. 481 TaxID=2835869 RepID=UPI001E5B3A68|nr:VOC family protein [Paenibacillus sp. 481]UHA75049.1 VOC family protein [Paenibacillus sp. 481]